MCRASGGACAHSVRRMLPLFCLRACSSAAATARTEPPAAAIAAAGDSSSSDGGAGGGCCPMERRAARCAGIVPPGNDLAADTTRCLAHATSLATSRMPTGAPAPPACAACERSARSRATAAAASAGDRAATRPGVRGVAGTPRSPLPGAPREPLRERLREEELFLRCPGNKAPTSPDDASLPPRSAASSRVRSEASRAISSAFSCFWGGNRGSAHTKQDDSARSARRLHSRGCGAQRRIRAAAGAHPFDRRQLLAARVRQRGRGGARGARRAATRQRRPWRGPCCAVLFSRLRWAGLAVAAALAAAAAAARPASAAFGEETR